MCLCVQYLPGGTVCRSSTDECDLPEYCNGSSSLCQSDVFVQVRPDIFQLLPEPPQLCPSDLQIYIRPTMLYRDVCSADTETLQAASLNLHPCWLARSTSCLSAPSSLNFILLFYYYLFQLFFVFQNGQPCRNQQAYCYNGKCQYYDGQCRAIFGSSTSFCLFICSLTLSVVLRWQMMKTEIMSVCGDDATFTVKLNVSAVQHSKLECQH